MAAYIIYYDEHYAECVNPKCKDFGKGCSGTSGDSRANLTTFAGGSGFNFDHDKQLFKCSTCGETAAGYYEVYNDPDAEDRADNVQNVTEKISPAQHKFNQSLIKNNVDKNKNVS